MISRIRLLDTLPRIFDDPDTRSQIAPSQIWLRDITFHRGQTYLIHARSGTGKTSLLSFIYGLRGDYTGTITFDDTEATSLDTQRWSQLRTHSLALLPQDLQLFPHLTVIENIEIKNRLTRHHTPEWIHQALRRLDIADKTHHKAAHLSLGQQQRVAIIRSLCQPFDFLLLDEPVSHLDDTCNREAALLISQEATSQGAAVIATSVGNHIHLPFTTTLSL